MFGPCKVCAEKDKRIDDLKEQIQALKLIITPSTKVSHYEVEQDILLSGGGEEERPKPISDEAKTKADEQLRLIQLEESMILSGDTMEINV